MTPELVFFAIRGLLRLGPAAKAAYAQHVRDEAINLPPPPAVVMNPLFTAQTYFAPGGDYEEWVQPGGPLVAYWDSDHVPGPTYRDTAEAKQAMVNAVLSINREFVERETTNDGALDALGAEGAGSVILQQWASGEGPPDPWVRIAVAMAGVALDFVTTNPGFLASGANGEKLVAAFASNLEQLLPDPSERARASFVERLAVVALQAGLETLTQNTDAVIDQKQLQQLLLALTSPLVEQFASLPADDVIAQFSWMQIRDRVLPEIVKAGVRVVAENQEAFLGKALDPSKSIGALTQAFLTALQEGDLASLGTEAGWMPIYSSFLEAVAARSDVLVPGTEPDAAFFRGLIDSVATALGGLPRPFADGWDVAVAAAALDTLHATLPFRTTTPWTELAGSAIQQVAKGLSQALNDDTPLDKVFTQEQFSDLVQLVMAKAAATPGMLTGNAADKELQSLVAVVAGAIAADIDLLVSADGWKRILAGFLQEAANNPGRLFALDAEDPEEQLAVKLISLILKQAAEAAGTTGRQGGVVLQGDTLVEAITTALKTAAGKSDRALAALGAIESLIDGLNALAVAPGDRIGAREWLLLFERKIGGVIDAGSFTDSGDELRQLLHRLEGAIA
jgi:hypothetical protein